MSDTDAIPEFKAKHGAAGDVGITNMSALTSGPGIKSMREVLAIVLVAVVIIGGTELLLNIFQVPQYVLPKPSQIAVALVTEFPLIAPHLGHTLVELFSGFAIGASVGLILAAVITQFPFAEKIVTPYILLLVTTPMLALVPLLILRFGFGYEPRIIAVALAAGPMVMINAATGFPPRRRRQDRARPLLRRLDAADLLESARPDGAADDLRRPDGRLDLRPFDGGRRRDGRRRLRPRQPPDFLFVDDPDAAVLRGRLDPLDIGHPHLRALLPAGEEVRELGGLSQDLLPGGQASGTCQPNKHQQG